MGTRGAGEEPRAEGLSMLHSSKASKANAKRAQQGELGPSKPVVVFLVSVVVLCMGFLRTSELHFDAMSLQEVITPTGEVEKHFSIGAFALLRSLFAAVGLATLYRVTSGAGLSLLTIYDSDSQIKGPIQVGISGVQRLATFTVQTWTMQTAYHTVTALLTICAAFAPHTLPVVPWPCVATLWVMYQVTTASSLLVTVIVTFVLVPGSIKKGRSTEPMFQWPAQVMHNCNLLFMLTELLFNRLGFIPAHFAFAVLYGLWYVYFSWWFLRYAGVVFYPFLDPSKPWPVSVGIHVCLLSAFGVFFYMMMRINNAAGELPWHFRALLLYTGAYLVTWTSLLHRKPAM